MLTNKQKADWTDTFTTDQWEHVMNVGKFPAVMSALTDQDLLKAEALMREALANFQPAAQAA